RPRAHGRTLDDGPGGARGGTARRHRAAAADGRNPAGSRPARRRRGALRLGTAARPRRGAADPAGHRAAGRPRPGARARRPGVSRGRGRGRRRMSTLEPGRPVELVAGITRLLAPNAGLMTGPGTNTYLVGTREVAVIDPGPALDAHLDAIVAAARGPIRWILVTHTHPDHSPGAAALAAATGAALLGRPAPAGRHQDTSFRPDRVLEDGDRLTAADFTLTAIHTPGHASNHLCYLDE